MMFSELTYTPASHFIMSLYLAIRRRNRGYRPRPADTWADLLLGDLVNTAVERVEKALGQVGAGAEELHLLANAHGGHAAGDSVVVAVVDAHDVVVLVLDRGGTMEVLAQNSLKFWGR